MAPSKFPRQTLDSKDRGLAPPDSAVHVYAPENHTFSPQDYAVGKILSGRFRVEHVIGVGSMGVVLAAKHLELDERVAIKFIRSEMQKLPGVLSRFARDGYCEVLGVWNWLQTQESTNSRSRAMTSGVGLPPPRHVPPVLRGLTAA